MKNIIIVLICLSTAYKIYAQRSTTFSGLIVDSNDETLIGATVNWKDTTIGAVTDIDGWFTIERLDTINEYELIINYVGYETASVPILPDEQNIKLVLSENTEIDDIIVESRVRSNGFSTINPINVETLNEGELRRAACCNLSEAFENNATVNISFTDAVTGAKEIEMLGLRGTYTMMQIENRPAFNRLGRAYGLEYLPGTFIGGIQIAKGASTVRTGMQSITGQINTNLIKPFEAPKLFINIFGNRFGRFEINTQFNTMLSEYWSTGLLVHGNYFNEAIDQNGDSFLDIPLKRQLNAISRWFYKSKTVHAELSFQGILDQRRGGQTYDQYVILFNQKPNELYEITTNVRRIEAFGKFGFLGFKDPSQSLAIIYSGNIHSHQSVYGNRNYDAEQKAVYANAIFQTKLINSNHHLVSGLTMDITDFDEQFDDVNYDRTEFIYSAYSEYDVAHNFNDKGTKLTFLAGLRVDYNQGLNYANWYVVPRTNVTFNVNENLIFRASAGRGVRNPNALIENIRYMPSNRTFIFEENIRPEDAWNVGLNATWNFKIKPGIEGNISLDGYRTQFLNQFITDVDAASDELRLYNLSGSSYANSFLVSYTQDIVKGLELRLAYKYNDVQMQFRNEMNIVPLMPRHRGLIHLNFTTNNKEWEFNVTSNIIGPTRFPTLDATTFSQLPEYRSDEFSPTFMLLNAHIMKKFKGGWEVYIGGENLTNYRQPYPIIGYEDPFESNPSALTFDASSVFAPIIGMTVYAGFKYTFKGSSKFKPIQGCIEDQLSGMNQLDIPSNTKKPQIQSGQKQIQIQTSSKCGMCKTAIEKKLYSLKGIVHADLDLAKNTIDVIFEKDVIQIEAIHQAVIDLGYDANDKKGNQKAYQQLPACCK